MRTRLEVLDLLSNNLSNSSTQGFKVDWEAYTSYSPNEDADRSGQDLQYSYSLPEIETNRTDFSQGQIIVTDSDSDLALDGPGFFQVLGKEGPLLTRQGRILVSGSGRLVTADGMEFAMEEPRGASARPEVPLQVSTEGGVTQEGVFIGRLRVVEPSHTGTLRRRDGVYFTLTSEAAQSLKASPARVQQRAIEAVNATPADSAAKLISVLRQFEALQRALQIGGELGRKAVEEVARVAP